MERASPISLDIQDDPVFQRREWLVQRVGWWLFLAVLLAAVLGVFGSGPLSDAEIIDAHAAIRYERFLRRDAPTTITIQLSRTAKPETSVRVDREYLAGLQIERIIPQPQDEQAEGESVVFRFATHGTGSAVITFHVRPMKPGELSGTFAIVGGQPVELSHFVYP